MISNLHNSQFNEIKSHFSDVESFFDQIFKKNLFSNYNYFIYPSLNKIEINLSMLNQILSNITTSFKKDSTIYEIISGYHTTDKTLINDDLHPSYYLSKKFVLDLALNALTYNKFIPLYLNFLDFLDLIANTFIYAYNSDYSCSPTINLLFKEVLNTTYSGKNTNQVLENSVNHFDLKIQIFDCLEIMINSKLKLHKTFFIQENFVMIEKIFKEQNFSILNIELKSKFGSDKLYFKDKNDQLNNFNQFLIKKSSVRIDSLLSIDSSLDKSQFHFFDSFLNTDNSFQEFYNINGFLRLALPHIPQTVNQTEIISDFVFSTLNLKNSNKSKNNSKFFFSLEKISDDQFRTCLQYMIEFIESSFEMNFKNFELIYNFQEIILSQFALANIYNIPDKKHMDKSLEFLSYNFCYSKFKLQMDSAFFHIVLFPYYSNTYQTSLNCNDKMNSFLFKLHNHVKETLKYFNTRNNRPFNMRIPSIDCKICSDFCQVPDYNLFLSSLGLTDHEYDFSVFCKRLNATSILAPFFTMCILCISKLVNKLKNNKKINFIKINYPTQKNLFKCGPNLVCDKCYNLLKSAYSVTSGDENNKNNANSKTNKKITKTKFLVDNLPPILFCVRDLKPYMKENIHETVEILKKISYFSYNKEFITSYLLNDKLYVNRSSPNIIQVPLLKIKAEPFQDDNVNSISLNIGDIKNQDSNLVNSTDCIINISLANNSDVPKIIKTKEDSCIDIQKINESNSSKTVSCNNFKMYKYQKSKKFFLQKLKSKKGNQKKNPVYNNLINESIRDNDILDIKCFTQPIHNKSNTTISISSQFSLIQKNLLIYGNNFELDLSANSNFAKFHHENVFMDKEDGLNCNF